MSRRFPTQEQVRHFIKMGYQWTGVYDFPNKGDEYMMAGDLDIVTATCMRSEYEGYGTKGFIVKPQVKKCPVDFSRPLDFNSTPADKKLFLTGECRPLKDGDRYVAELSRDSNVVGIANKEDQEAGHVRWIVREVSIKKKSPKPKKDVVKVSVYVVTVVERNGEEVSRSEKKVSQTVLTDNK